MPPRWVRVALVVLTAWLGLSGCTKPWHAPRRASPGGPLVELHGPPPPGVRLPRWVPRARVYYDGALRYRLLDSPSVTFDGSLPQVGFSDEPLIAGRVGLKLHVDAAGYTSADGAADVPSDVGIRRAFLTSSGVFELGPPVQYNLEFGILQNDFYLDSAWLMWRNVPWVGTIRLGALDAPLGFENRMSSRDRTFMEMPAPVQAFVPATSLGLFARRTWMHDRISAGLGWYTVGQRRDVGDQSRALARFVGRVNGLVRDAESAPDGRKPEIVHLGLAGSYTFGGADSVRYQSRPESFLAPVAVDTGTVDASQSFVLGFEAAARRGPLTLQSEIIHAFANHASARFPGMYVSAAYLLTGEVRPYDREQAIFGQVVPRRAIDWRARTLGAAECAARWSWVDLENGHIHGGRLHELGAGFNWYWNAWVRWQAGYHLAFIDGGPLDGRLHVFQLRFQLVI